MGKTAVVIGKCVLKSLSKRPLLCLRGLMKQNSLESIKEIHKHTGTNTQAIQRDTIVVMTARHSSVECFNLASSPRSSEELIRQ